ncbi:MAG TPA: general secretion pathway protein GspB [Gammaproteobacteria bacterium]|nr:general secretion pathway protein GspB [Gammaproteobacteria bacterium]
MSLILDALRKSERSRRQSLTGQIGAGETPSGRTRLPVPWVTLLGVLLLINAIALGIFYWRAPQTPAAGTSQPGAYRPSVRPLAEEAATAPDPGPPAVHVAPAPLGAPAAATGDTQVPVSDSSPPATAMPAGLPPLHLDVHAYAVKPADRFVMINLAQYHIGDTLKEGPRVVDITPQGVILEYQGSRFLLPRT